MRILTTRVRVLLQRREPRSPAVRREPLANKEEGEEGEGGEVQTIDENTGKLQLMPKQRFWRRNKLAKYV